MRIGRAGIVLLWGDHFDAHPNRTEQTGDVFGTFFAARSGDASTDTSGEKLLELFGICAEQPGRVVCQFVALGIIVNTL